jgi:hypothetical protein
MADEALYEAKNGGRDQVRVASPASTLALPGTGAPEPASPADPAPAQQGAKA